MHTDHAAVEKVREKAARKGVDLGLSNLLATDEAPPMDWRWSIDDGPGYAITRVYTGEPAARLIVTGALAAWLAGHGIAVVSSYGAIEWVAYRSWERQWVDLKATDHLSALIAATEVRLAELPDAPAASSKEHP